MQMERNKSRRRAAHMCVLKADFQNCRTQLAQGFFTSSKRAWRGGCSGNLLLDTPAKIVLESAFYDAPAHALPQQNVLMCEIRRHWRLFAVASRANSSSRPKVCNAICWLFRFAAGVGKSGRSGSRCCWGCGPFTHAKLTIAKCKMC